METIYKVYTLVMSCCLVAIMVMVFGIKSDIKELRDYARHTRAIANSAESAAMIDVSEFRPLTLGRNAYRMNTHRQTVSDALREIISHLGLSLVWEPETTTGGHAVLKKQEASENQAEWAKGGGTTDTIDLSGATIAGADGAEELETLLGTVTWGGDDNCWRLSADQTAWIKMKKLPDGTWVETDTIRKEGE